MSDALIGRLRRLAADWIEDEDEANDYGPRSARDGRDCAEMLIEALSETSAIPPEVTS